MVSNEKSLGTKNEVRFNVRLPSEIHERLTLRARENGRSMNSEIVGILDNITSSTEEHILERLIMRLLFNDEKSAETRHRLESLNAERAYLMEEIKLAEDVVRRKHAEAGNPPLPSFDEMLDQVAANLDSISEDLGRRQPSLFQRLADKASDKDDETPNQKPAGFRP